MHFIFTYLRLDLILYFTVLQWSRLKCTGNDYDYCDDIY